MHVFYIDDDTDDLEVFGEALKSINLNIKSTFAANGREAFEKLESLDTLPDVMFVDVNMPAMDGKSFLKVVKEHDRYRHIPVIMYSTSSRPQDIKDFLAQGAKQFVVKPGSFKELCDMLAEILSANS